MLVKTKLNKEKSILLGIFIVLFSASFVLIMLERGRIEEELSKTEQSVESKISQIILGEQVSRTTVVDYRDIIRVSYLRLLSNINRFDITGELDRYESTQAYNDLLSAKVPTIYQNFHIDLVSLARYLSKEKNPRISYLVEERDLLFEGYPWLYDLIK
jgi:hypothetical protein